jgi:hypothetical protein
MSTEALAKTLTVRIRGLAATAADAAAEVETYLDGELRLLPPAERVRHLEAVAAELGMAPAPPPAAPDPDALRDMVARAVGKSPERGDLPPAELVDKFGASLETLFDTLNAIVATINVTLLGHTPELETIRTVIGSDLTGQSGCRSMREYLERIQKAFLVAHDSFQEAATATIAELLGELDPESHSREKISALKFGPLRKAELFDLYAEKHRRCRQWLDSGEHRERLLREFERQCQLRFDSAMR